MGIRLLVCGIILLCLPVFYFLMTLPPYLDPLYLANKNLEHLNDVPEPELTHSSWSLQKIYRNTIVGVNRERMKRGTAIRVVFIATSIIGLVLIFEGRRLRKMANTKIGE